MKKHKLLFGTLGAFTLILVLRAIAIAYGLTTVLVALVIGVISATVIGALWVNGFFKWLADLFKS